MGVTIHKTATKEAKGKEADAGAPVLQVEPEVTDPAVLEQIEAYGEVMEEAEKLAAKVLAIPTVKRLNELQGDLKKKQKALEELVAKGAPAEMARTGVSANFQLDVGAGKKVRNIIKKKLLKILGTEKALELAGFLLKDVDDYLTKPQRLEVAPETRDGSKRSFKVKRITEK